jgi:ABC-type Fe3+ transport system permease subunit
MQLVRGAVRVASMGYAVPGTVIAVGVMLPFAAFDNSVDAWMRARFDISTGLLLSGTLAGAAVRVRGAFPGARRAGGGVRTCACETVHG